MRGGGHIDNSNPECRSGADRISALDLRERRRPEAHQLGVIQRQDVASESQARGAALPSRNQAAAMAWAHRPPRVEHSRKSLSENPGGSQGDDGELKMQEAEIVRDFLFPADQKAVSSRLTHECVRSTFQRRALPRRCLGLGGSLTLRGAWGV